MFVFCSRDFISPCILKRTHSNGTKCKTIIKKSLRGKVISPKKEKKNTKTRFSWGEWAQTNRQIDSLNDTKRKRGDTLVWLGLSFRWAYKEVDHIHSASFCICMAEEIRSEQKSSYCEAVRLDASGWYSRTDNLKSISKGLQNNQSFRSFVYSACR